jgi:hypothetical protein
MCTNDPQIQKILAAIGREVSFKFPGNEGRMKGTLKDRVVIPTEPNIAGVPYWDVVDLISFSGEPELWIRIGYYRKPKDRLVWAAQTTIIETEAGWKRILLQAAREKEWFRRLLEEVYSQLKK